MSEGEGFREGVRLALDWGDARIGVAACDRYGLVPYPHGAVLAGDTEIADILAAIAELEPFEILVGLPISLSGDEGLAAATCRERAQVLAQATPLPVRLVDERLTTVTASRKLREGGKKAKQQRQLIDAAAAVEILRHALETERNQGLPPGELVSAVEPG